MFPKLVRNAKTDIQVILFSNDIGENGEPITIADKSFKCNYQNKAKKVRTKTGEDLTLTGTAYIDGDILPEYEAISSGKATVFGDTFSIVEIQKARNLDGSVNFTTLWLV